MLWIYVETQCTDVICDNNSTKEGGQSYTEAKFLYTIKIKLIVTQTKLL